MNRVLAGVTIFLCLCIHAHAWAQEETPTDPYGDPITTVDNINEDFFLEAAEEIILAEDEDFVELAGDELDYNPITGIRTFENYIDMPAQFESSLVHNERTEELRAIYIMGPSDSLDQATAKEWYDGLVKLMVNGNETREWDMTVKTEKDVAGLPERTTFFLFAEDYSDTYIEIYYTAHQLSGSRVNILFIFPL